MPAFQFQRVLLHELPGGEGWQIIGIKHNRTTEQIALISSSVSEWLAQRWADMIAQDLTGKPSADID